jgi:hypothetical protein
MIFKDLNLKPNTETTVLNFNNYEINVLKYLPIEDKNALVQLALQNSEENGIYNPVKINMFAELYLVYLYTDIEFTEEEKNDPKTLYDILKGNNIINMVISVILPSEYEYLCDALKETMERKMKYRNTIASVINNLMENLPKNAEAAADIINKFNPEDFQRVIEFAQAANGGRPIN